MRSQLSPLEKAILTKLRDQLRHSPPPAQLAQNQDQQTALVKAGTKLLRDLFSAPPELTFFTGPLVTTPQVADWFYISRQGVVKAISERRLLALKQGRFWHFPVWQLVPERIIPPAIQQLQDCLPAHYSPRMRALWFNQPQPLLAGSTPGSYLQAGKDLPSLLKAAKSAPATLTHAGKIMR